MKILFVPMDGHGHVNSTIGLAEMLREFGHECIFVVLKQWIPLVEGHGFRLEKITDATMREDQDPQEKWGKLVRAWSPLFALSPIEQVKATFEESFREFVAYVQRIDAQVEEIISKVDPAAIVMDFYVTVPSIVNSGKVWVVLNSANPLRAYERPDSPPAESGLGCDDDPKLYQEFRNVRSSALAKIKQEFDQYLKSKGITPDPHRMLTYSPYLNVYPYPEDLDYYELAPCSGKWFRLDHMVRKADQGPLGFDPSFLDSQSKLVLFTLGSMGSSNVDLMKRLISILAKSKHRFIVSKGTFHDEIELVTNMTGGKYLNQVKVLPLVDLVIHHGGNNSFVETLYYGKPCIILPLFGDQFDNGLRAVVQGIGKCFNPNKVTEEQLLAAIDEVLSDRELIEKVSKIGEKMRSSQSHVKFNQKLIQIVEDHQANNKDELA